MKKIFIALLALATIKNVHSQNVGIRTTTPTFPLTVGTDGSYQCLSLENGSNYLRFKIDPTTGPRISTNNQALTLNASSNSPFPGNLTIIPSGDIGIGVDPLYKLDVGGRMRIRNYSTTTAGIYLDGTSTPNRAFVGMVNEDYVGFYGNGGAGWNFAMNVETGNVGIGTQAPTARLDVNGDLRIRGSFPKKGSILTSNDASGNAKWADPIAFRVTGGFNGAATTMAINEWTKVLFNQSPAYNAGLAYQGFNSQFVAPEKGIYHFDTQLHWEGKFRDGSVRLRLSRNGNLATLAEKLYESGIDVDANMTMYHQPTALSTDVSLEAGDIIWVEGYYYIGSGYNGGPNSISSNSLYTWFSGHLITRL